MTLLLASPLGAQQQPPAAAQEPGLPVASAPVAAAAGSEVKTPPPAPRTLEARVVLFTKDGAAPAEDALVEEVAEHVRRTVPGSKVPAKLRGEGKIVLECQFPSSERLVFERMVAELSTKTFTRPIGVEDFDVRESAAAAPRAGEVIELPELDMRPAFRVAFDADTLNVESATLRLVPLGKVLAFLAQRGNVQYLIPAELEALPVSAHLRQMSLDDFLQSLKTGLHLSIKKQGQVYIFSRAG